MFRVVTLVSLFLIWLRSKPVKCGIYYVESKHRHKTASDNSVVTKVDHVSYKKQNWTLTF